MKQILVEFNYHEDGADYQLYQVTEPNDEYLKRGIRPSTRTQPSGGGTYRGDLAPLYIGAHFYALQSAILDYGITATFTGLDQTDVSTIPKNREQLGLLVLSQKEGIQISRDIRSEDFFDLLRDLDETLVQISEYIRGINNPDVLDARLKLVRASADAMRCYIDIDNEDGPEEIPSEVVVSTRDRLKSVDWKDISEQANKWVQTIIRILNSLA